MKAHEHAVARQLAQRELAYHAGPNAGTDAVAAAAQRAYEDLARVSAQLIGEAGVVAVTGRALHLAEQAYPWLLHRREPDHPENPFAHVVMCLRQQDRTVAADAAAAVLATLAGLLVIFLGESLTAQLLRKAWPDAFSPASAEDGNG